MARDLPSFEQWLSTARPVASVTLDASLRPAWLVDAAGDRLDPRVLGWARVPADDAPLDPPEQDRSSALTTALEIGGVVVAGVGLLGLVALMVVGDAAGAATGWSSGGSGQDEFVQPESWGRWTERREVEWVHAPALRFVEGGVLTGLPQTIDVKRSDKSGILPRERLVLRAGEEHVELFVQRRSRGRYRWRSTDVLASRPVPALCEPDWRVAHGEIAGAELLDTSKGQDGSESRRVVLALTFADGSALHLRLESGQENQVVQVVRHRAGLPGPWRETELADQR
ncbi:hypothetical protein OG218_13355 [Kineococcus sp. NBC_00420]|uniref:hypothetical protein n=1 Tax=unclassified Kineococcus TaxID=2621656 RepID=UPI002E1CD278